MEKCISEMNLDISNDAVICDPCYDTLASVYIFKQKCFQTEERIYSFMEQNNLGQGDKIDLSNLVESSSPDTDEVVLISDSDSDSLLEISLIEYESGGATINQGDRSAVEDDGVNQNVVQSDKESSTSTFYSSEPYSCAKCKFKTHRKDVLEKHVHMHCKNRTYKYKCDVCPYENVRKRYSDRYHITDGRQCYVCGVCDKKFKRKSSMRLHILYKHAGSLFPYKCRIEGCKESFLRKADFNTHIVKHVKYRPFMCQLCKKAFFNASQWDRHMKIIHGLC